jgi:hypothetical protein
MPTLHFEPRHNPISNRWMACYTLPAGMGIASDGDSFTRQGAQDLCDKANGIAPKQPVWVEPAERKFGKTYDDPQDVLF